MKVLSTFMVLATVALGAVHAEEERTVVGIPESYTAPKTALGNPVHVTAFSSHDRTSESAVGVPMTIVHPLHHKKSASSSDGDSDAVQRDPHAQNIAELLRLYGKLGKHDNAVGNSDLELPTPAPTTSVTPAPTVPQLSVTPAPTTPSFRVTPSPTVPTATSVEPDASNPYIKQVALPMEAPTEVTPLAVDSPTPTTELLHDSEAVGTALSVNAPNDEESSESSVALPVVVLGCVAAALAVAAAVFVQKKKKASASTTVDVDTTSPSVGGDVPYKNDMVTPV